VTSSIRVFGLLTAVLLASSAAHAFDATGTWEGQWSCKEFDGVKFTSKQKPSTLRITQNGSEVFTDIDDGSYLHDGHAINDGKKPEEKGEMVLVDCVSDDNGADGFAEQMRAAVKVNATKGSGSFKGVSVYQDVSLSGGSFGTCKYKYKRIDTANPNVAGCP
jgi:hypothetical protein